MLIVRWRLVLVQNLRSETLVVQSAENWHRPAYERQCEYRAGSPRPCGAIGAYEPRLIFEVKIEQMAEMPFAEHNNAVKTIPSDRTIRLSR